MWKILSFLIFAFLLSSYSYSEEFFKAKSFENWDVLITFRDGKVGACHTVSKPFLDKADGYLTSLLALSYIEDGCFSLSVNLSEDVLFGEVGDVFVHVGKIKHKLRPKLRGANTFSSMQDKAILNDIIYESSALEGSLNVEIHMKNGTKTVDKYQVKKLLDSMIYIEKNC
ncbi:hypothetical protein Cyrtocomes_00180 [Candidatus Cyrtobacter comes]|uniref:Uncharacterized protein n=1 Tax=Candidatus Cyrtobacter comes TaxID=675776 RepID=A0ABU5L6R5_9RICK|nr:hypothetical protein [Candidatus Cyrtobacter comes]MDZ5761822.1 hypothetical protein [Candidatus Cyrtobacter comes]